MGEMVQDIKKKKSYLLKEKNHRVFVLCVEE